MKIINHLLNIFPQYNALENAQILIERQRKILLFFFITAILFGLIFNAIGISGPQNYWFLMQNRIYFFITVLLLMLYLKKVIKLDTTLVACAFLSQITTSVEMIASALNPTPYHLMLIVGNLVILAFNVLFNIAAYLKKTAYALCILSIAVYVACTAITKNDTLINFSGIFIVAFCLTGIMTHYLVRSVKNLYTENNKLRADERDILRMLRTNKTEIKAYIELARTNQTAQQTTSLLEMMTEESKQTLLANVKKMIIMQETDMKLLEKVFPELSPSELEICQLILQDKKLSEICQLLDKNESNINSQRAHIRKKLNMNSGDNLKQVLAARMKQSTQPQK